MLKIFLILLRVLLISECKLKFLVTLHRHGACTPNDLYTADEGMWNEGQEMLTELGKAQMRDLGKFYREKYILSESEDVKGLFKKEVDIQSAKDFFFLCSPVKRSLESFWKFYEGLFENSKELNVRTDSINQDFEFSEKQAEGEKEFVLRIPQENEDLFFHAHKSINCRRNEKIINRYKNTLKYQKELKKYREELGRIIAEETNKKCNQLFVAEELSFEDISGVLDLIISAQAHNKLEQFSHKVPVFSDEIMEKIKDAKLFDRYKAKLEDDFLPRISTTLIFRLMRQFLKGSFYNSQSYPKWFEISAHDNNIAAFLRAFLTDDELCLLSKNLLLIPFAAHFELEFHQVDKEDPQVKFIYNNLEVKMSKCGDPCLLSHFLFMIKNIEIEEKNLVKLCDTSTGSEDYYVVDVSGRSRYFSSLNSAKVQYEKMENTTALASSTTVLFSKESQSDERLRAIGHLVLNNIIPTKLRTKPFTVLWHQSGNNVEWGLMVQEFNNLDEALQSYERISSDWAKAFFEKGKIKLYYGMGYHLYCIGAYTELDEYFVVSENFEIKNFKKLNETLLYYESLKGCACMATSGQVLLSKPENQDCRLMTIGVLIVNYKLNTYSREKQYTVIWHQSTPEPANNWGLRFLESENQDDANSIYQNINSGWAKAFFNNGKLEKKSEGYFNYPLYCAGAYTELPEYYVCASNFEIKNFTKLQDAKNYYNSIKESATLSNSQQVIDSKNFNEEARVMTIGYLIFKKILKAKPRSKPYTVLWYQSGDGLRYGLKFEEFDNLNEAKDRFRTVGEFSKVLMDRGNINDNWEMKGFNYFCIGAYFELDLRCTSINQYIDVTDRICKRCDSTCKTCSEKLHTNCLSCSSPRFHSNGNGDGECITNCLIPRFAHEPTRKCLIPCPAPTWGSESDRKCKDTCATTHYTENSNRICTVCDATCKTCRGPTSDDCLSCSGSRYLYGYKCQISCLEGKYGKSSTHTCENCDSGSHCKTCETPDQPTKCLSCEYPYYLKNNACVLSCALNEYKDDLNRKCEVCHSSCSTCFNGLETNCLSCSGSLKFYDVDNSCLSVCPNPYFATSNLCLKTCPAPLFGVNSTRACESTSCLTNEYADSSDRICKKCHSDCLTCNGLANTDCQICVDPYYKKGATCTLDCGSGYYGKKSSAQGICEACTGFCLTCVTPNGPSRCLSCGIISGVSYFLISKECTPKCPIPLWGRPETFTCEISCLETNPYGDPKSRICGRCPRHCLTCNQFKCLTCNSNSFLFQNDCILCGKGYWTLETDDRQNKCIKCSEKEEYAKTKKECVNSSYLNLITGKCVAKCPSKTFENQIERKCQPCSNNCAQCVSSTDNCKECVEGFYLFNFTCVPICPIKYFGSAYRICLPCYPTCERCSGEYKNNCTSCVSGFFLRESHNECSTSCQEGFYPDEFEKKCKQCHKSCLSCSGSSHKECFSCTKNHFLFEENTCLTENEIPIKFYADYEKNKISQCNSSLCLECYSLAENCSSCHPGFFLDTDSKECNLKCDDSKCPNNQTRRCEFCKSGNNNCFEQSFRNEKIPKGKFEMSWKY